jgi:hypothetical protein
MATEFNCLDVPDIIWEQRMCLNALSKDFKGDLGFIDARKEDCQRPNCRTLKAMHSLRLGLESGRCDSKLGSLLNGEIIIERLVSVYEEDGEHRGFHAGDFVWNAPGIHAAGRISGMTNVGTHRRPYFDECQQCDDRGLWKAGFAGRSLKRRCRSSTAAKSSAFIASGSTLQREVEAGRSPG